MEMEMEMEMGKKELDFLIICIYSIFPYIKPLAR